MGGRLVRTPRQWPELVRGTWVGYAGAFAAVGLVSALIGLVVRLASIANISMLYLIAVLVSATVFGIGPAILASVAAFLAFDWFFVEPLHAFTVDDPAEWLSLLLLLVTAVITGSLAGGQRLRARLAEQREREAVVLYDVVRMMSDPDLNQALQSVAERLRSELHLVAVAIDLPEDARLAKRAVAGDPAALPPADISAQTPSEMLVRGAVPTGGRSVTPGRWIRVVPPRVHLAETAAVHHLHVVPVQSEDRRVGLLTLAHPGDAPEFSDADDRLLSAVAAQVGLAVERRRLRRDATEAEILRRTDELKTALLNAVSHDLRTPLASIMASAGGLLQEGVEWSAQERKEFAHAIEHESRRLNQLVGNLLDLSRIEAGILQLDKGWYDLSVLVEEVLGRLRPLTRQHQVVVDIPEDLAPVPLSYVEIDQVLSNLIENAAKYAPPGSEILISVRQDENAVRVEVADRGPGIPPSALPRLFEPFFRVSRGRSQPKGTGVGLAVAKGLVEAHGGRIRAENRPGGGARFIFTLPMAEPAHVSEGSR
jgi:two-component system, OmpR family, sensor histidine kinase KdpD